MASILFGAGLVLVLALLISTHIRISGIPDRAAERAVARLKRETDARARADADALEQAAAGRVAGIMSGLEAAADQIAGCAVELERIQRDAVTFLIEQRAHMGELAALVRASPEQRAGSAPRPPEPAQVAAGLGPRPPRPPCRRQQEPDTGDSGAWPDRARSVTSITLPSMKAPLDPNTGGSR